MIIRHLTLALTLALQLCASSAGAQERPPISFNLVDQNGISRTQADFAGKPVVLHFGFTHCPVVCPTTLYELAQRMSELGEDVEKLHFVLVSADPDRDTPDVLKRYIASFDERIIGLTGGAKEIENLARQLGAQIERRPLDGGGYEMAHTIFGYLFTRDWQRTGVLYMGSGTKPEVVIKKLQGLVVGTSKG